MDEHWETIAQIFPETKVIGLTLENLFSVFFLPDATEKLSELKGVAPWQFLLLMYPELKPLKFTKEYFDSCLDLLNPPQKEKATVRLELQTRLNELAIWFNGSRFSNLDAERRKRVVLYENLATGIDNLMSAIREIAEACGVGDLQKEVGLPALGIFDMDATRGEDVLDSDIKDALLTIRDACNRLRIKFKNPSGGAPQKKDYRILVTYLLYIYEKISVKKATASEGGDFLEFVGYVTEIITGENENCAGIVRKVLKNRNGQASKASKA